MLGSPVVAETIAREGFPPVVLDAQHGLWDTGSLIADSAASTTPAPRLACGCHSRCRIHLTGA